MTAQAQSQLVELHGGFARVDGLRAASLLDHDVARIIPEHEAIYRFTWELLYHDGTLVRQYQRTTGQVLQTMFGRLPRLGVKTMRVLDELKSPPQLVATITVPDGCEADIVYDVRFTMDGSGGVRRVYNFGWRNPLDPKRLCEYLHIDPSTTPPSAWVDARRFA